MATAYTSRPTLNFDFPEPATRADPNAPALFPSQPVYARTPKKKPGGNLPLMVGAPIMALVAGGLVWMAMGDQAEAPTDPQSLQAAAAQSQPDARAVPTETPATPLPQPTELATNDAVTPPPGTEPVARTATPRASTAVRAPARARAAVSADGGAPNTAAASSNVSATIPAPPPTVATPTIAEPPPLVIPAPAAPQTTSAPQADPVTPM